MHDERFCRMWEFYLAAVELEFLHGSHMVFQMLLSTKRDAVPITRDFMVDSERRHGPRRTAECRRPDVRPHVSDDR
jgi:hypothetical protein